MAPPIPPAQLNETLWTSRIGPGNTLYTVGYKAGEDDIRFNFENDNSYLDLPMYLLWGANAQFLDQAKRDILGYPIIRIGLTGGLYVSRVTPMTALPFLQLTNGLPYLFAVQLSGTGWGVPDNGVVKNSTLSFPVYKQTKCMAHFETLTYDVFTDTQMVLLGAVDSAGNPDEATLLRYVTKEIQPGIEYLTLPQGGFQFVTTPTGNPPKGPPVPGTAGKLTPNYDVTLTWELVPVQCIGTILYNPSLTAPPIDVCLGCVNNAPFPPAVGANNKQVATAVVHTGGAGYNIGDVLILQGGIGVPDATLMVDAVSGGLQVTSVLIINRGNYVSGVGSPPANPIPTITSGVGTGCTIDCTFSNVLQQQLMTAYPAAAGTGYALGDILTLAGGTGAAAATVRVVALSAVGATGPVLAVDIITRGSYLVTGLPSPPTNPVTTTGGTGSGCTLTCEFGNGIPPGQLLMTAATITPIRSSAGDRLYRLGYRFKYLPQGIQRLYYQGTAGYINGPTVVVSTVANTINPLITTSTSHGFSVGNVVTFNGTGTTLDATPSLQVATVPSPTTFTVVSPAPGAGTGGAVGRSGAFQDGGYFEVTTNGFTNIGSGLYNNNPKTPPLNIYPWANFATLFRVPS